jgi:uncharacterized protein YqgV (UPF0045/DUF77 family)
MLNAMSMRSSLPAPRIGPVTGPDVPLVTFTNIEGEWDEVMAVVKQAVEVVAASSPRGSLVLKADIRPGYTGQLTAKVQRVEDQLG